jgi:predicted neuraminidase
MRSRTLHLALIALTLPPLWTDLANGENVCPRPTPARANVVESTFVFPKQRKEHVHASSIVELPDGALLAAWFQGSGECEADDVRIMGARKPAGMAEWGEPFLLADTPGHPDCNPVLWIDDEERLWLFWSAILSNDWGSSLVKYRTSTNYMAMNGPPTWDWQDSLHLKPADFHQHMLSGWKQLIASIYFVPRAIRAEVSATSIWQLLLDEWKVLVALMLLVAGTAAVNAWRRRRTGRAGWKRFVLRATAMYASMLIVGVVGAMGYFSLQSSNKLNQRIGWMTANKPLQLATGEIVLPLYSDRFVASIMAISSDGGTTWQVSEPMVGYGNIQPSLVECSDGKLIAWMRESGPRKRIRYSASSNQGRTWSPVQESALPNPGAKVAVTSLASGDWVVAYNPLVDGRHSLCLAISDDEGDTWRPFHHLDETSPEMGSFSYPCLTETSDGCIHVTYSYRQRQDGRALKSIKHVILRRPALDSDVQLANSSRATQFRDELLRRCKLDERDVMNTWRNLFDAKEITSDSLAEADALLEGVSGESPLHIRLANELEEIRKLQQKK